MAVRMTMRPIGYAAAASTPMEGCGLYGRPARPGTLRYDGKGLFGSREIVSSPDLKKMIENAIPPMLDEDFDGSHA
jgi:hypothetical protein